MESKSEYIPVLVWNDLSHYIANFMQSATTNLLLSQGKALDILCVFLKHPGLWKRGHRCSVSANIL